MGWGLHLYSVHAGLHLQLFHSLPGLGDASGAVVGDAVLHGAPVMGWGHVWRINITLNTQIVLKEDFVQQFLIMKKKKNPTRWFFCVGVGGLQAAGALKWKGWQDSFATHPLKKQLLEIFQTLHHLPISSWRTSVHVCNG